MRVKDFNKKGTCLTTHCDSKRYRKLFQLKGLSGNYAKL